MSLRSFLGGVKRRLKAFVRGVPDSLQERLARQRIFAHPGVSSKAYILGARHIELGRNVRIHPFATIDCRNTPFLDKGMVLGGKVIIGDDTVICSHAMIMSYNGFVKIGRNCSVNPFTMLYGQGGLEIGDNTRIACHSILVPSQHIFEDPTVPIYKQGLSNKGITVGSDVWIGTNVSVMDGVVIGDGSVVAAQSVVTKSFPKLSVIAGVPARRLKERGEKPGIPTESGLQPAQNL